MWCDRPIALTKLNEASPALGQEVSAAVSRIWATRVEEARDALSIKCPNPSCAVLLDLDAEACTAMSCSQCSIHFCYACLARFATREAAHRHVPLAHDCESVFAPRDKVPPSLQANAYRARPS